MDHMKSSFGFIPLNPVSSSLFWTGPKNECLEKEGIVSQATFQSKHGGELSTALRIHVEPMRPRLSLNLARFSLAELPVNHGEDNLSRLSISSPFERRLERGAVRIRTSMANS